MIGGQSSLIGCCFLMGPLERFRRSVSRGQGTTHIGNNITGYFSTIFVRHDYNPRLFVPYQKPKQKFPLLSSTLWRRPQIYQNEELSFTYWTDNSLFGGSEAQASQLVKERRRRNFCFGSWSGTETVGCKRYAQKIVAEQPVRLIPMFFL